jgi:hypothetical protein
MVGELQGTRREAEGGHVTTHLEDEDIQTIWRGVKPSASTSPDDSGIDDPPPTDAPGQDGVPGSIDDPPPTDAPGQDGVPGSIDDPPIG